MQMETVVDQDALWISRYDDVHRARMRTYNYQSFA